MHFTPEKIKDFREQVVALLKDWQVPSITLGIIENGETVYTGAVGNRDLENGIAADETTLYMIGSCTKAFTAALAAILVDRGLLDWDEPLIHYVTGIDFYDDYVTTHVTMRDLLCHRTGMPRHELSWYGTGFTREEIMENYRFLEPNKPFRTTYQYSNQCFMYAGKVIETLFGKPYEECLQEYIFTPLGMTHTTPFLYDMVQSGHAALPYSQEDVYAVTAPPVRVPYYESTPGELESRTSCIFASAGSICSCSEDMMKWVSFHLNMGLVDGKQVISRENMFEMHKMNMLCGEMMEPNVRTAPESDVTPVSAYGLGWGVDIYRGRKCVNHSGGIDGFITYTAFFPELNCGLFLSVNKFEMFLPLVVKNMVQDILLGCEGETDWAARCRKACEAFKAPRDPNAPHPYLGKQLPDAPLSCALTEYTGVYEHKGYRPFPVREEGGRLYATLMGREVELKHFHYDAFTLDLGMDDIPPEIPVVFNVDGKDHRIHNVDIMLLQEPGAPYTRFQRKG